MLGMITLGGRMTIHKGLKWLLTSDTLNLAEFWVPLIPRAIQYSHKVISEAIIKGVLLKKVLLEISLNSQENTYA